VTVTTSNDEAARRAAVSYWERRSRGEHVGVDDVLDVPTGDSSYQATRATAIAILARDVASCSEAAMAATVMGSTSVAAATVHAGSRIGPSGSPPPTIQGYEVVGCLGQGGMGAVYEAYQQSTGRRVAIKLMLEAAALSDAARLRFEREVEVVARLDHPGIVSVLDSGVRRGRYFYVMEYVDGQSLERTLAPGRCEIRRAMELLAEVCSAMDYAHQRGVLHRDLKPSNIIVDSRGRPRLLDFGIAKLIDEPGEGRARRGITIEDPSQLLGTVAYMSPEQAQGRNEETSVRTDVYALGAIGYELLTGKLPCPDEGTLKDVLTRIAEVDPAPPSTLRKGVPRDIDAVLLKALEKAPERRYATAGELAADLTRWLRSEPVSARRLSPMARAGRWVLRHRTISLSTAAALVAIAAVSAVLILQVLEERDHARENFSLLRGVLESADPERSTGLTVIQLLDMASARLDEAPPQLALTEADVRTTLGTVYRKFGEYAKARAHQERVLAIQQQRHRADAPEVAEAMHNLAATLWWDGSYERAEELYGKALEMRQRLYRKNHPAVAMSMTHLAACRLRMGRLSEARELYAQALAMRRGLYGPEHEEVAQALNNLAKCEMEAENLARAEALFRESLALVTQLRGESFPGTAAATQNLGECLLRRSEEASVRGDTALTSHLAQQAIAGFESARSVRAAIYPGGHHLVAASLGGLARARLAGGDAAAAWSTALEGLDMIRRTRRPDHPEVADLLEAAGLAALEQGRLTEAEVFLREAVSLLRGNAAPPELRLAQLRGELGRALTQRHERIAELQASYTALAKLRGPTSYLTVRAKRRLDEAWQAP
jgi:tetratricopeptide (TPR) repeat protein/predicted Ser/Thr protein kinase